MEVSSIIDAATEPSAGSEMVDAIAQTEIACLSILIFVPHLLQLI